MYVCAFEVKGNLSQQLFPLDFVQSSQDFTENYLSPVWKQNSKMTHQHLILISHLYFKEVGLDIVKTRWMFMKHEPFLCSRLS